MATYSTPGVYVNEPDAFPNSVVEVPTSVPVFIGMTETTPRDKNGAARAVRIDNFDAYTRGFGGPPPRRFAQGTTAAGMPGYVPEVPRALLYDALRLFYDNGGGPCWILSTGGYAEAAPTAEAYDDALWATAAALDEPAICIAPDAVSMEWDGYKAVTERMLRECQTLGSRVALLDLHGGAGPDLPSAIRRFRDEIDLGAAPSHGVVYAPWLNTSLHGAPDLGYTDLSADARAVLASDLRTQMAPSSDVDLSQGLVGLLDNLTAEAPDPAAAQQTHTSLMAISTLYAERMAALAHAVNLLPPAGAVAGVYAAVDMSEGVFRAPANVPLRSVESPVVVIDDALQADMNTPLDGKAVNALRAFPGRGVLIWGARTLDGNSADYRYINVHRTLIMLEGSISQAAKAYAFEPNDAATWASVRAMIGNFLTNQWKAGALMGNTPAAAFQVEVGLGSTMTAEDVLAGVMRTSVRVALVHPAEFIVLTFDTRMQGG